MSSALSAVSMLLKRHRIVNFRLTDEEYEQLRTASIAHGSRGLSDYARTIMLANITAEPTNQFTTRMETALARLTEALDRLTARVLQNQ